ncbi:MAG: amidophosphoribosyltransferase [Candidatus Cloacimonetes bacterium]|nr:amidophosphoribosyltransferase [Candidatus Cloacimonadota bacterium]
MCGILGIFGHKDISQDLIYGLVSLQHRGQDAAGAVVFKDNFRIKKGLGLVNEVFKEKHVSRLQGQVGIGHVRYATQGDLETQDSQPFAVNYPYGLAMAHNGNVTNFREIRKYLHDEKHRILTTSNDLELLLYTFAAEMENKNLKQLSVDDIFTVVKATQNRIIGAYSTITIIANKGFLAFKDPYGIRPLALGKKETAQGPVYAFASESTCFDYLGFKTIRELEPGEAVFIDMERNVYSKICVQKQRSFCVFEYIYFAREDSIIHDRLVASERVRMGKALAKKIREKGLKPDIIIDVPSSAYFFASGLAEALDVPYRRGLAKNNHVGRSFIKPLQKEREELVSQKLNPIREVIEGKKVAVVDDSIVRGTTSRHMVKLLRRSGAKKVYFISAAPPIQHPCVYGIDMSIKTELIAGRRDINEIENKIGADALVYQSLEDLKKLYKDMPSCYACFSGQYPTKISEELLNQMEKDRICSKLKKN